MRLGVSSACFFPQKTEDSINYLLESGVRELEVFINTQSELDIAYLKNIKRLSNSFGARIKSIHPFTSAIEDFLLFSAYERRFTDTLEYYKSNYFEAANILEAEICVIHGAQLPLRISEEEFFERFAKLCNAGKMLGVVAAQENVYAHFSAAPDALIRMKNYIGSNFSVVFDVKQAVKSNLDPYLFAEKLKECICHIHLSDNSNKNSCLLPGYGDMDFIKLLKIVNQDKYETSAVVEVYSSCFKTNEQVIESVRALSEQLNINM